MDLVGGYTASDWGNLYHNLPHDEALGAGSAGPGKTTVLIGDVIPQIYVEHERCRDRENPYHQSWGSSTGWALHLRRTLKNLEQTIHKSHALFKTLDPEAKYNAGTTTWEFSSGYRHQFGHCKDPNTWQDYMGFAYTHVSFDELVEFEEEQYFQIKGRVRSSDPVLSKMLKTRAMSNPLMRRESGDSFSVSNPHWVRDYFVKPAPAGKTTLYMELDMGDGTVERATRIYLPARLDDNPDKAFVRQYKKKLLSLKPHQRAALLYGDWFAVVGGFYSDEWNPQIHVCEPFEVPPEWPIFRSLDWGYKAPGCVLWATMDGDENIFIIRELTFLGKTDAEVADIIRQIESGMGLWEGGRKGRSLITGPADYHLWEQRGDSGKSKGQVMAEKGVAWTKADKHSRSANAERFLYRLKDHQGGTATPGIVFFNTCVRCIETIPAIQTDTGDTSAPMDGGEDHWHDAVLYLCAYASRGRRALGKARRAEIRYDHRHEEDDEEDVERRRSPNGWNRYGTWRR